MTSEYHHPVWGNLYIRVLTLKGAAMSFTTTLRKTGNSESVVIPKPLREQLGVHASDRVKLDSPRPGVVVIRFGSDVRRREKLDEAEATLKQLSEGKSWPDGCSAEELVAKARVERTHGSYSL